MSKDQPASQILIVEDDSNVANMLSDLLGEEGYRVHIVSDGKAALEFLTDVSPDLVLLDLNLPHLSGNDVLKEIRRKDREYSVFIPVIILTGVYTSRNDKVICLNSGADDFLAKPFDMVELMARVRSLIRLREMHKRSQYLATHDHLTRCYNRRFLLDFLDNQLARYKRYKTPFSFVLIDLDHFKKINDDFGHDVGDQVLIHVGFRLQDFFRAVDCLARLGGDEFAVLLPDCDLDGSKGLVQRFMKSMQNVDVLKGLPKEVAGRISFSLGISSVPKHTRDKEEVIRLADQAMYTAKKGGPKPLLCRSCREEIQSVLLKPPRPSLPV